MMAFPYKILDLTHTLHAHIPTWHGGCGFHHEVHRHEASGQEDPTFRVMKITMDAGMGTHMDAPSHILAGGKCIHDFEVKDLVMPCVVMHVASPCHERYSLSLQDIGDFESKHGTITQGSCVMVNTGWSKFWNTPCQYHNKHVFPSVSPEAASCLMERGVRALGIDTLSPDRPEDGFKVHKIFLGQGKIIIENVANLHSMPPLGSFVMVLPMKIQDGTEAPVRLVGLMEKG